MSPRQFVVREQVDDVTVLSFGTLTSIHEDVIKSISEELLEVAESQPSRVLVDLSGIDFFGSSFIEVLFRLWNRVKATGGQFALCHVSTYCREVLTVTNLETLWPMYPDRATALAEMKE